MRALHCSHRVTAGTQPPPEPSRAPAPATMHAPRIGTHPSTPEAAALTLFSCPTRRSKRREPSQCFKGLRSLVRPDPPSAAIAAACPARRARHCTLSIVLTLSIDPAAAGAAPVRSTAARRPFELCSACTPAAVPIGAKSAHARTPCPHILRTVVPAASAHPPCPLPLPPSQQVMGPRARFRLGLPPFAHWRSRSAAVSARCAPRVDSHQRMLVHVTHPDRPCPVCAENGVRRRPHTNTTSTLQFQRLDCLRGQMACVM